MFRSRHRLGIAVLAVALVAGLLVGRSATRTADATTSPTGTTAARDPFFRPFTSTSIWNMPIGSNAQYVHARIPRAGWVGFDPTYVIRVNPNDPLRPVLQPPTFVGNRCGSTTPAPGNYAVPVPDDFIVDGMTRWGWSPNNLAAFIWPDGRMFGTVALARCEHGGPVFGYTSGNPAVDTTSLYDHGTWGTHGGSQLNTLGGLLRPGELSGERPIQHALDLQIWGKYLWWSGDMKTCPAWPALVCDAYAEPDGDEIGDYGYHNPALKMGSLLAIHPSATPESLGITTAVGRRVFQALQDYGGYITDTTAWNAYQFSIDKAAVGTFDFGAAVQEDFHRLMTNLHVVVNNGPNSIGGGGTPRRPLLPELTRSASPAPAPAPAPAPSTTAAPSTTVAPAPTVPADSVRPVEVATPVPGTPVRARLAGSDQCLDATASPVAGTRVALATCSDSPSQRWVSTARGELTPVSAPALCLNVPTFNPTPGMGLVLWGCWAGPNQTWTFDSAGTVRSALAGDWVLHVPSPSSGTQVVVDRLGTRAASWTFPTVDGPPPPPTVAPTTAPATTAAPTTAAPTTVAPTTAAPTTVAPTTAAPTTAAPTTAAPTTAAPTTAAPALAGIPSTGATVTVRPREASGLCVDGGSSPTAGTVPVLRPCTGSAAQRFVRSGSDELRLASNPALCLNVSNMSPTTTTNVVLWGCWAGPNQRWTFSSGGRTTSQLWGGWCLDVPRATAGDRLVVNRCGDTRVGPIDTWTFRTV
jgi:hypothetical protein